MEFIVCMLLASILTGGRITTDIIHGLRGTTPPHVEKARLKAQAQAAAKPKSGRRSPYAEGKPRLRDVAAVYWGDAMADAIDAHDRRRADKQKRGTPGGKPEIEPQHRPQSLLGRIKDLILQPVGEKPCRECGRTDLAVADGLCSVCTADATEPEVSRSDSPRTACDECGQTLRQVGDMWQHPSSAGCPARTAADEPAVPVSTGGYVPAGSSCPICGGAGGSKSRRGQYVFIHDSNGAAECPAAGGETVPDFLLGEQERRARARRNGVPVTVCGRCGRNRNLVTPTCCQDCADTCPQCGRPADQGTTNANARGGVCEACAVINAARDYRRAGGHGGSVEPDIGMDCRLCGERFKERFISHDEADDWYYANHRCPARNGELVPRPTDEKFAFACDRCGHRSEQIYPSRDAARVAFYNDHQCPTNEGEPVTDTKSSGTATGDAHDLESASQQCELLGDDLRRIDASLDVIDEAITSAGAATELVEAFLKSKNVDDTTVGGMATAREMLSPERIKALMDAIAAAKAGLQATKEALDAMNDGATAALNGADGSIVNGR